MTPCETRALLNRIDQIRERIYRWALPALFAGALVDVGIRNPQEFYDAAKWPLVFFGSLAALDLLIRCVLWCRRR
jgi:hypothetical protein